MKKHLSNFRAAIGRRYASARQRVANFTADKGRMKKTFWVTWVVVSIVFLICAQQGLFTNPNVPQLPVNAEFTTAMSKGAFLKKVQTPDALDEVHMFTGMNKFLVRLKDQMSFMIVDFEADPVKELKPLLEQHKVTYSIKPAREQDWWARQDGWFTGLAFLFGGLGVALFIWSVASGSRVDATYGGLGIAGAEGMAGTASEHPELKRVTFVDVAGAEEALVHLRRIQRKLKYRLWYDLCGAPIPKGLLFVGPPGTGKTLLARALAGEVDGGFHSCSGSDFVEMYVGVGAKRVREKIEKAKEAFRKTGKLQFFFIDEIDAVGMQRSTSGSGGDQERNQTLNQILVAMDGFSASDGIVFLAATNLESSLDKALTRPGRFEHKIVVDNPDIEGRHKIFIVHTRNMKLADDVDLLQLAIRTPDFSGSHIAMTCREAATYQAERSEHLLDGLTEDEIRELPRVVTLEDFDKAIDYVQFGDELLSRMRNQTEEDRWNTCVHEGGHGVVATAIGSDPVTKLTRSMRSKSLGMMQSHSESDRYGMKEVHIRNRIKVCFGGRAAQEVILGYRDTGASNDFEQGNRLARLMVAAFGMSELGPISFPVDKYGFPAVPLSPSLASAFDRAWRKIVNDIYSETLEIVKEHQERIVRVARGVLEKETILADEYMRLYNGEQEPGIPAPDFSKKGAAPVQADAKTSVPDATGYSL